MATGAPAAMAVVGGLDARMAPGPPPPVQCGHCGVMTRNPDADCVHHGRAGPLSPAGSVCVDGDADDEKVAFTFALPNGSSVSLRLRERAELTIGLERGETGNVVWDAGALLAAHLLLSAGDSAAIPVEEGEALRPLDLVGRRVVELGAGTGIAGIVCARFLGARVVLTDVDGVLPLLRTNAAEAAGCLVHRLEWGSGEMDADIGELRGLHMPAAGAAPFDLVLLADVLYAAASSERDAAAYGFPEGSSHFGPLVDALCALTDARSLVLLAYSPRGADAERTFFELLSARRFVWRRVRVRPGDARSRASANPRLQLLHIFRGAAAAHEASVAAVGAHGAHVQRQREQADAAMRAKIEARAAKRRECERLVN